MSEYELCIPNRIKNYITSFSSFLGKHQDPITGTIKKIQKLINVDNLLVSVIFLTVYSNVLIDNNLSKIHGYNIAYIIFLLIIYIKINEYEKSEENDKILEIYENKIILILRELMKQFRINKKSEVIKNIIIHYFEIIKKQNRNNKQYMTSYQINKNDIYKIKEKILISDLMNKYKKQKIMTENDILEHIKLTYGQIGILLFKTIYLITDLKDINEDMIEELGNQLGIIFKILIDIKNIENDINENNENMTYNIVLNLGIIKSYEIYIKIKDKFIENCMILKIYKITMNEIIQLIDKMIIYEIDKTDINPLNNNYSIISELNNMK